MINTDDTIKGKLPYVIFWLAAIIVLFSYLGVKEIWGPEDRWAEISREMMLTGNYFHPTINGQPYFDKPLLSYWLIVATAKVTGQMDEWSLRFPSVIAGLLALWGTIKLGQKLFSERAGLTAGWILLGTYGFIFWARTGEADMENLAAIVLAVLWYWMRRDKPGFVSYLVFYLICFVGAHTKGMATIAVPMVIILPDILREKRWKSYLSVSNFLALGIGLAIYFLPFIYSDNTNADYPSTGLRLAIKENVVRYFNAYDHKEPFWVYFYYVPRLFFPWTILLVGTLWTCGENFKKLDWPTKWILIANIMVFMFFTMSGSRRQYYILPILPFCGLLVSQYLTVELKEKSKQTFINIQNGVLTFILIAEMLSPLIWPVMEKRNGFVAPTELKWMTFIIGAMALGVLILNRYRPGMLARITGTEQPLAKPIILSVILIGGFFAFQQKPIESLRTLKDFSLEAKQIAQEQTAGNIMFFGGMSGKVLFHLETREPVPAINDETEMQEFLDNTDKDWMVIASSYYYEPLEYILPEGMFTEPVLQEKVHDWENESDDWQKDGKEKFRAWIVKSKK